MPCLIQVRVTLCRRDTHIFFFTHRFLFFDNWDFISICMTFLGIRGKRIPDIELEACRGGAIDSVVPPLIASYIFLP